MRGGVCGVCVCVTTARQASSAPGKKNTHLGQPRKNDCFHHRSETTAIKRQNAILAVLRSNTLKRIVAHCQSRVV
jgi:hypothetical protein